MNKSVKKYIKVLLNFVVLLFIGIYIYQIFVSNQDQLMGYTVKIKVKYLVVSFFMLIAVFFSQSIGWYFLTKSLFGKLPFWKTNIVWYKSLIGKYIPGKIWMYIGRGSFYFKLEDGKFKYTSCVILEGIFNLLSAIVVAVISFTMISLNQLDYIVYISIFVMIALFIVIHPNVMNFFISQINKIPKVDFPLLCVKYNQVLLLLLFWIASTVFGGGALFYLSLATGIEISNHLILYFAAVHALASFIGLIAFFSPGGIGVRESIYIILLEKHISSVDATLTSIFSRIWITVIELFLILCFWTLSLLQRERTK